MVPGRCLPADLWLLRGATTCTMFKRWYPGATTVPLDPAQAVDVTRGILRMYIWPEIGAWHTPTSPVSHASTSVRTFSFGSCVWTSHLWLMNMYMSLNKHVYVIEDYFVPKYVFSRPYQHWHISYVARVPKQIAAARPNKTKPPRATRNMCVTNITHRRCPAQRDTGSNQECPDPPRSAQASLQPWILQRCVRQTLCQMFRWRSRYSVCWRCGTSLFPPSRQDCASKNWILHTQQ